MHRLEPRRVDEDLAQRPRQRHAVDFSAVELDGDLVLHPAILAELIEVRAHRGLNGVDEMADDAVLVEALDLGQIVEDLLHERRFADGTLAGRRPEPRIEADMEQRGDLGGDRAMPRECRPQIVLRIGHADLPQIARQGAQHGDVAPRQAGREHQRVEAVVLGQPAHHHQEAGLEMRLGVAEIDLGAVGAHQRQGEGHVVQPEIGRVAAERLGVIGRRIYRVISS